jgi:hypothetical protein
MTNAATASSKVGGNTPDPSIVNEIEKEFRLHFADSLDNVKSDFHITSESSFSQAQIGKGIAYYMVATKNPLTFRMAGYKFPLELDGKQVGVITATNYTGTWKIEDISNHQDFGLKLASVTNNIEPNSNYMYIDDRRYGVQLIYVQDHNGERLIDLKTNRTLSKKQVSQAIEQYLKSYDIQRQKLGLPDDVLLVGAGGIDFSNTDNTDNIPAVSLTLSALGSIFLLLTVIFFVRWRKIRMKA